jgi:hypothetical protein
MSLPGGDQMSELSERLKSLKEALRQEANIQPTLLPNIADVSRVLGPRRGSLNFWLDPSRLGSISTVDEFVKLVVDAAATQDLIYDPFQFEQLISDLSGIVDRILAYRREAYDFDASALKSTLEFQLFDKQVGLTPDETHVGLLENIELAGDLATRYQLEKDAHLNAANAFGGAADALGPGFAAIESGMMASAETAETAEKERKRNVHQKWLHSRLNQLDLLTLSQTSGGALNYRDRFTRVLLLLGSDVWDAWHKARSALWGMTQILHFSDIELPSSGEDKFLEKFILWLRDVIRRIEIEQQNEVDFEHIISLTQTRVGRIPLIFREPYNRVMREGGTGILTLDLSTYFSDKLTNLRIRQIGLSYSGPNATTPDQRSVSLSAQVFPPTTPNWNPSSVYRPPAVLSTVAVLDPTQSPRMYRGANINNISPRGEWRIIINPNANNPKTDLVHPSRKPWEFTDIKLHLSLVARPQDGWNWADLNW